MQFSYKGRNATGAMVDGVISAQTRTEAIEMIRDIGVIPFEIKGKSGISSYFSNISLFKGVKITEKIIFTKNMSGMIKAGLPLTRALQVLSKQTKNKYFKTVIESLIDSIDKGNSLSDGLTKYPSVFSALFVAMVRAGEESGGLPGALTEIGSNLEKTHALNRKVKSALMYPSIIILAIIIIAILMFIYVVPTLTSTFTGLGVELPQSTRIVVGISDAISNHVFLVLGGLVGFLALIYMLFKLPRTKQAIDFVIIRVPVLGTLVTEINTARTTRTMSSLLTSGVNISRAIAITKEVVQNVYYKRVLEEIESVIQKGEPISSVFKKYTRLYPVMVGEMIEVGEETGKLSSMLIDVALFYEGEVDAKTKDLSTIIEPVLMIFIGAGVGFFAISMLSPMYSIMDSIK